MILEKIREQDEDIITHMFFNLYKEYSKENQPWESWLMTVAKLAELLEGLYAKNTVHKFLTARHKKAIQNFQDSFEIQNEWTRLNRTTLRKVSKKKLAKVFVPAFWRIAAKIEKQANLQHGYGKINGSPATWTLLRANGAYYLEGRVARRKVCEALWNTDEKTITVFDDKLFPLWVAAVNDTKNYKSKPYYRETW